MTGFWRVIKESLRYKWSLAASVVNALLIGVLWGVSITTVYPFVEVVLQGQTIQTWYDGQIKHYREAVDKAGQEIVELQRRAAAANGAEAERLRSQLLQDESGKATDEKTLTFFTSTQPWVCKHVPSSA